VEKIVIGRRLILTLLAALVWLVWCLPPLIGNRPDDFQASGSVIVLLAVLIYARERVRRENEVFDAQRLQIVSMLEQHDSWGDFHASQTKRDTIENDIKILRLRSAMKLSKDEHQEIDQRIEKLSIDLSDGAERHGQLEKKFEVSHAASMKANVASEETVRLQTPNAKAVEKLELALIAYGTLQWGYGDRWVEYLLSTI